MLQPRQIVDRQGLSPAEHFANAIDARRHAPRRVPDVGRGTGPERVVIGGGEEPCVRIQLVRQLVERAPPLPLVLAGRAGDGIDALPVGPHRDERSGLVADVAVDVGVHEILARNLPALECAPELLPVGCAIERQGPEVAGRPGFAAHPSQRVREVPLRVDRHNRTVRGVQVLDRDRFRSPLHANLILHHLHVDEAAARLHLSRVRRIQLFDVEVLHVCAEDRQPPRDAVVVPDRHTGKPRHDRADHVPARRIQVHEIAQRRMIEIAVRIVGEHRLARRGLCAGDDPVVTAFARRPPLPVEKRGSDRRRCRAEARGRADRGERRLERRGNGREIDAGRRRRGDRRVERQQHRRPLESDRGRDTRAKQLVVRVRGHGKAFGAAEQILGLPRLGTVSGHGELLRQLLANRRNLGIDAGDETRGNPARVRRVALPFRVHVTAIPHEARDAIAVDVVRTENLGEPPLSRPAPQIDLEQPVLRLDKTLCEEEIVGVLRVDVWNAPPVADDAYLVGEAGDLQRARRLRQPPVERRVGRRWRTRVACAAGQHDRQAEHNHAVQRHVASPSV